MTRLQSLWVDHKIKNKITQIEAAKELGWSQSTLSQFITGRLKPNTAAVIKLSDYFDVDPIEIDELGVFIVKINSISPQKIVSLEKARKEIINLLNEDSIYQIFLENIDLIEEMNLTGSTIEDITDSFNLKFNFSI